MKATTTNTLVIGITKASKTQQPHIPKFAHAYKPFTIQDALKSNFKWKALNKTQRALLLQDLALEARTFQEFKKVISTISQLQKNREDIRLTITPLKILQRRVLHTWVNSLEQQLKLRTHVDSLLEKASPQPNISNKVPSEQKNKKANQLLFLAAMPEDFTNWKTDQSYIHHWGGKIEKRNLLPQYSVAGQWSDAVINETNPLKLYALLTAARRLLQQSQAKKMNLVQIGEFTSGFAYIHNYIHSTSNVIFKEKLKKNLIAAAEELPENIPYRLAAKFLILSTLYSSLYTDSEKGKKFINLTKLLSKLIKQQIKLQDYLTKKYIGNPHGRLFSHLFAWDEGSREDFGYINAAKGIEQLLKLNKAFSQSTNHINQPLIKMLSSELELLKSEAYIYHPLKKLFNETLLSPVVREF